MFYINRIKTSLVSYLVVYQHKGPLRVTAISVLFLFSILRKKLYFVKNKIKNFYTIYTKIKMI